MDKRKIHVLGILMIVAIVSESSVIVRRGAPSSSADGEFDKGTQSKYFLSDKKLGGSPGIWNPFGNDLKTEEFDTGIEPEDDDISNEIFTGKPGTEPERYPSDLDHNEEPDDGDDEDEKDIDGNSGGSSGIDVPFDNEEDFGGDGEPELPDFEDGHEFPGGEEGEEPDEGDDDQKDNFPVYGHDEGFGVREKGPGFFEEGSIFDTPFFNLGEVRKYFHQLERALEHVFKQTLDEARLLNGTYANTTEEEVDINGKKYIVQKSIIKGADNRSSIYVETLSSKRKEGTNGMEVKKNETYN